MDGLLPLLSPSRFQAHRRRMVTQRDAFQGVAFALKQAGGPEQTSAMSHPELGSNLVRWGIRQFGGKNLELKVTLPSRCCGTSPLSAEAHERLDRACTEYRYFASRRRPEVGAMRDRGGAGLRRAMRRL